MVTSNVMKYVWRELCNVKVCVRNGMIGYAFVLKDVTYVRAKETTKVEHKTQKNNSKRTRYNNREYGVIATDIIIFPEQKTH